ncbi:DUF5317 family protein [Neobacillus jeddahensis]|uniref:DUF5317 family protein n=1 Tax=Neobacillus jeddahensis TaxID=1461580 RepID=UPI00058D033B|nr:DUF5317 family protein [Neobacillus jeddahensis]
MKYFLLLAIVITLLQKRNPLTFIKNIEFQWPLLLIVSFGIQISLVFITIETKTKLELILVLTIVGVIVGLWKNRKVAGVKWMVMGAILNLAALLMNGGSMPVSEEALLQTGQVELASFVTDSRHHLMEDKSLFYWVLGDWIPAADYVLSPGDVLVGIGIMLLIILNSSKMNTSR